MKQTIKREDKGEWGRTYTIEGERYPSVTSILGKYGNDGLISWAGATVGNYIREQLIDVEPYSLQHVLDNICDVGIKRPNIVKNTAAARGIYLHDVLANHFNGVDDFSFVPEDPFVAKMLDSVRQWETDAEFEPAEIETIVYSKRHGYAGTLDIIGNTKDGLAVVDFKSGRTVQKKVRAQLAAYAMAWDEMYDDGVETAYVLHLLPSGNIKPKLIMGVADIQTAFDAFLGLLEFFEFDKK